MVNIVKRIALFLIGVLVMACSGSPTPVQPAPIQSAPVQSNPTDELDAVIRETSDYLNKQLPAGNKLVILNIQSEFPALSEYIIDELIANTVNDGIFTVVDRQQLDTIRAELDFQYSGEVDDDTMQALGRMAGAQTIISGAVSQIGDLYRLRVRALGVENAQIQGQFNRNIPDSPTVAALVRSQATGYGSTGTRPVVPAASAPVIATPPAPTYKIGSTGPAGGIVFYDKGYFLDGWQYLEVASRDVGIGIPWSASKRIVNGTSTAVGTGKRNTELIVGSGENISAALVAAHYSQGGYNDWYLPSKDELDLMYRNLQQRNLGGFSGWYWSSSDAYTPSNDNDGWCQNFSDGRLSGLHNGDNKHETDTSVRPIRQF
jgi:hypothetical protein